MADTIIENLVTRLTGQPESYFRMLDEADKKTTKAALKMEQLQFQSQAVSSSLAAQAKSVTQLATSYDRAASEMAKAGSVFNSISSQINLGTYTPKGVSDFFGKSPRLENALKSAENQFFGSARRLATGKGGMSVPIPIANQAYQLYDAMQEDVRTAKKGMRQQATSNLFAEARSHLGGGRSYLDSMGMSDFDRTRENFEASVDAAQMSDTGKKTQQQIYEQDAHSKYLKDTNLDQMREIVQKERDAQIQQGSISNAHSEQASRTRLSNSIGNETGDLDARRRATKGGRNAIDSDADDKFLSNALLTNGTNYDAANEALAAHRRNRDIGRGMDANDFWRQRESQRGENGTYAGHNANVASQQRIEDYKRTMGLNGVERGVDEFSRSLGPARFTQEGRNLISTHEQALRVGSSVQTNDGLRQTKEALQDQVEIQRMRDAGIHNPEFEQATKRAREKAGKNGINELDVSAIQGLQGAEHEKALAKARQAAGANQEVISPEPNMMSVADRQSGRRAAYNAGQRAKETNAANRKIDLRDAADRKRVAPRDMAAVKRRNLDRLDINRTKYLEDHESEYQPVGSSVTKTKEKQLPEESYWQSAQKKPKVETTMGQDDKAASTTLINLTQGILNFTKQNTGFLRQQAQNNPTPVGYSG